MKQEPAKDIHILVVDDEVELLQLMRHMLVSSGYDVAVAENGRQALERVQVERPDLILCDVVMPELNGFETVRALRSSPETKDLHVIMVSARGQRQDVERALTAGANGYITKPFSYKDLLEEINRQLRSTSVAAEPPGSPTLATPAASRPTAASC